MAGLGQPFIRSTFKLLLQPFASPVGMPAWWPIPRLSHRGDDVPMVLLELDSLGMRSQHTAHLCPSPPLPPQPPGVPGVWGARVVLAITPGFDAMSRSLWLSTEPRCGVSCFLSGRRRVCFRLFLSCSAAGTGRSPTLTPAAGPWGTCSSALALTHGWVSQELASGRAALGAKDPYGLTGSNLAFTRLQRCKCLN